MDASHSIASRPVRAAPPIGGRDIRSRKSGAGKGLQDERNDGSIAPGEQGRVVAAVAGGARAHRRGGGVRLAHDPAHRSEEHTSELQSLMRISYAVFCLKKKKSKKTTTKQAET